MDPILEYHNLDLWVARGADGKYSVRGKSAQGDFQGTAKDEPAALGVDNDCLAGNTADAQYVQTLGRRLHQFLFDTVPNATIQTLLDRSLGAAHAGDCGLRIRLQLAQLNPEIAAIPWEFLYADSCGGFLASSAETPVVRFLEAGTPLRPLEARLPLDMLAVIPDVPDLRIDAEKERLYRAVQDIDPPVTLTILEGTVTRQRFSDALTKRDFDMLHFVGHGAFDGERGRLRLNLSAFEPDWIDQVALAELLHNRRSLRLVVLNTCRGAELSTTRAFAGIAPQLVLAGVPAVVAMQYPITDDEAVTFAHAFYYSLFQGSSRGSVDLAITAGRSALNRDFPGTRAIGVPTLFTHYNEGVLFRVVSGTGNVARDAPYHPAEAAKERALIRELKRNTDRLTGPGGAADPGIAGQVAEEQQSLARARGRLRFRNMVVATPVAVVLFLAMAAGVHLLDRLTLTWIVAASPVWFGDPVARSLPVDSVVLVVTQDSITRDWRPRHAQLLDKLSRAGARVVAFDIRFKSESSHDSALAAAVDAARARGTQVVGGSDSLAGDNLAIAPALAGRVVPGLDCLGENPLQFSGIVPLVWARSNGMALQPSLPLAIVAAWRKASFSADLDRAEVTLIDPNAQVTDRLKLAKVTSLLRGQRGCPIMAAGSWYGEMLAARAPLLEWRNPDSRRFDYATVLGMGPDRLQWARGRIVLVGAEVSRELSRRRILLHEDARYGVERHADAVVTMLGNAELVPVGAPLQFVLLAGFAGLAAWLAYRGPKPRLGRVALTTLGIMTGLGLASVVAYWVGHRLLNILYPALAFLLTFGSLLLLRQRWLP